MKFSEFLIPNKRPYLLGDEQDADLVGMRLYGAGPFHREHKLADKIVKKSHFVIRAGDVIYNKLFAWKGAFGIVPEELDGMFVSDKFPTYELDISKVDPGYLQWFFRNPVLWEQARRMSTGSAALSKLTLNPPKFLELTFPDVELSEQRRMATRLDAIRKQNRILDKLNDDRILAVKALLASVLNKVSNDISSTGKLGDALVGKPRNGWSPRCDGTDGGTPVLGLGAVTGWEYRASEFKKTSLPTTEGAHYWLQPGDLIMTRSNTPELVGHAAIYDGHPAGCIFPDLMMRLTVNEEQYEKRFVWYWLQTPAVRAYIKKNAKGTSPTMKKIAQGIVMDIPFPSQLSKSDQRKVTQKLDRFRDLQMDMLARQLNSQEVLSALEPAAIHKAFNI